MTDETMTYPVLTRKKLTPREEEQLEALYREKAKRDRISIQKYVRDLGYAKGYIKGYLEGRTERILEVADNLRAMEISEEQIALFINKMTGEDELKMEITADLRKKGISLKVIDIAFNVSDDDIDDYL